MTITSKIPTTEYRANYAKVFGPKVEEDQEELVRCPYCGILTTNPCDAPVSDYCEQAITVTYGSPIQ